MCQIFRLDEIICFALGNGYVKLSKSEEEDICRRVVSHMLGREADEDEIEACRRSIKKQITFLREIGVCYLEWKAGNRVTGLKPEDGDFTNFLVEVKTLDLYHKIKPLKRCKLGSTLAKVRAGKA
jgi:hypothetical protein